MKRPYVVYKEGNFAIGGGDPIPHWLNSICAYGTFCKCELVGRNKEGEIRFPENRGWHQFGSLYGNVFKPPHECFLHGPCKRGCVDGRPTSHIQKVVTQTP